MSRFSRIAFAFLILIPYPLFAKANTSKITIEGTNGTSIEITDAKLLEKFRVWAGAGTSSDEPQSLIVKWSSGSVAEPQELQPYQVKFFAKLPKERLIYVVQYKYDSGHKLGYVHIPGRTEEWYSLDVGTILRGVEGKWFHASSAWDKVAGPLLTTAK